MPKRPMFRRPEIARNSVATQSKTVITGTLPAVDIIQIAPQIAVNLKTRVVMPSSELVSSRGTISAIVLCRFMPSPENWPATVIG